MAEIKEICEAILERLECQKFCPNGHQKPLLMVSNRYPGLWLEHVYDSIVYAEMYPEKLYLAENAVSIFFDLQRSDGQLPFVVRNDDQGNLRAGYSQIQECVSIGSLALRVYKMNGNKAFLKNAFDSVSHWVEWLRIHRMTRGTGLVEMFCGYDTGHDNSARVLDLSVPGNYKINGEIQNASVLPPDDKLPIIAVDMNCNFYGNLKALAKMAVELGLDPLPFEKSAQEVKQKLFEVCFDKEDCFFYDVDNNNFKRKILSSQIFHLFIEGVLDKDTDAELITELCKRYIFNEKHFYTPYPFPAVSISDPTWKPHTKANCWGYYTQGLITLRCTLWMEKYGFFEQFEKVCRQWVNAWTEHYDTLKLGQELHPVSGQPSSCSEWYSAGMLMYLFGASHLGL